jgi:hypothetical protein
MTPRLKVFLPLGLVGSKSDAYCGGKASRIRASLANLTLISRLVYSHDFCR